MASEHVTFLSQCASNHIVRVWWRGVQGSPIWNAWYFDYNSQKVIGHLGFLSAPHFVAEIRLQLDLQILRNNLNRSKKGNRRAAKNPFRDARGVRRKLNYMSKVGKTMQTLCPSVLLNWNRRLHISVECMDVCGYKKKQWKGLNSLSNI